MTAAQPVAAGRRACVVHVVAQTELRCDGGDIGIVRDDVIGVDGKREIHSDMAVGFPKDWSRRVWHIGAA